MHVKGKRIHEDVDLDVVARGTPGMSGADLSNLVNEAALIAVRNGDDAIRADHFEDARDRALMGQKRESMAMSDEEKEMTAYHEARAPPFVPPCCQPPTHFTKGTIIPSGMALGVTMQLPAEDRHTYRRDYLEDRLTILLGGRMAEDLVFGVTSTGAGNDLVQATETTRKMVREWGMSERVGPMAWGSQSQVFLGDDLMHSRDYSDETAHLIDQEVQRILTKQEARCREVLTDHRHALDLVARSLLEHETIRAKRSTDWWLLRPTPPGPPDRRPLRTALPNPWNRRQRSIGRRPELTQPTTGSTGGPPNPSHSGSGSRLRARTAIATAAPRRAGQNRLDSARTFGIATTSNTRTRPGWSPCSPRTRATRATR
ncbi:MAG: hypothetical protein Ct9H300mP12_05210 [Acidimicrobiales bacterium]|nr:MAG: hypothetical protein Ct9H300mP12_05210 [Acidimicrobiales bacterium]